MIRSPIPRRYQRGGRGSGSTPADEPRVRIFTPTFPGSTVELWVTTTQELSNSSTTPMLMARACLPLLWKGDLKGGLLLEGMANGLSGMRGSSLWICLRW